MDSVNSFRHYLGRIIVSVLLIFMTLLSTCHSRSEVVYAVNCGGEAHVDVFGVHYQRDTLTVGTASEHGKVLTIRRIAPQDQILYQTERYHTDNFVYSIPIKSDGEYVLIMKFSEVWFTDPNQKVFSVHLNDQHIAVDHLDIFANVGLGVAHDEVVPFLVKNGRLYVNKESSEFDGYLNVEFVKLHLDNPKVNAIYVMRGRIDDVPMLAPLPVPARRQQPSDEDDDDDSPEKREQSHRRRRPSPEEKVNDPYATDDPSSMLFPVIIAIAAFVPIVFCLCKL